MKKRSLFTQQNILWRIMLLACVVRIAGIAGLPGGLNQDEASIGYEAFSILKYGMDRNGISNPIHLLSWGSGQNIAYAWLCMPFIAVMGLSVFSVRLPMALAGCVSVYVFYLLVKEIYDERTALWAGFYFAVFPWHIMKSRWALESNIFPDLVLWAVLLLVYYVKKQKAVYLYTAVAVFAFSVYSYGTAYMFIPMFLAGVWLWMLAAKKINIKHFVRSAVFCFILVLPIMLFVIINITDGQRIEILGFTIPKMYQQRFSVVTVAGENMQAVFAENLKKLWQLFISQGDGLLWNSMDRYGICYLAFVPLIFSGVAASCMRRKNCSFIIHWWAICAIVTALVTDINVNRINIIFIPVAYFISVSLAEFSSVHKAVNYAIVGVCVVLFVSFGRNYTSQWERNIKPSFFASYNKALDYATEQTDGDIYISTDINQPYMLTLFYTQAPPQQYISTVEKSRAGVAFEQINSFDRFYFYAPQSISGDIVYITEKYKARGFDKNIYEITDFEYYSVIKQK